MRVGFQGHPFAPTEFPKVRSTTEPPPPVKTLRDLSFAHPERRISRPSHVDRDHRLLSRVHPRVTDKILGDGTNSPRTPPRPKSKALWTYRCPRPDPPPPILATTGPARAEDLNHNWNGERTPSAPGERPRKYEKGDNATRAWGTVPRGREGTMPRRAWRDDVTRTWVPQNMRTGANHRPAGD